MKRNELNYVHDVHTQFQTLLGNAKGWQHLTIFVTVKTTVKQNYGLHKVKTNYNLGLPNLASKMTQN